MKTLLQTSLVLAGLALTAFNSAADTRIWTNVVGNANWSNAANWSNGVPVDGDSVVLLRHPTGSFVNAVNDLTNLTLASLSCESLGYNLGGNKLFLAGDITIGGPAAFANLIISAPLEILGPATQILNTNGGNFGWSGLVTAPTGAVVTINGGIGFNTPSASDYRAETRLESGFMALLSTRLKGPLIVGGTTNPASVVLQSGNVFGEFPSLTILSNGTAFNISTFQSVGPLLVDGGVLRLGNRSPQGEITVNGNALLTGGATMVVSAINLFGPGSLSVTGTVTIAGCSLSFQPSVTFTRPTVIVRNDGPAPVTGTFTGLPEGSVLTNNLVRYTLSYVGGDGNDITVSPIIEPAHIDAITVLTNSLAQLTVQGQPGFTYVIEATTSLLSPPALISWQPISANGSVGNGQFSFTDPDSTNFPQRFYRVVAP